VRTLVRYVAMGFAGYVAVSVLLVLPALNLITPYLVQHSLGRVLESEIILFNPLTLTVEIRRANLMDPGGETFLSADKALVNISIQSLWHQGLVFDAVTVESLYVHVKRLTDGKFNFSDMLAEPASDDQQTDGELPGLTIHQLALHARQIKFTDEARKTPFVTRWDDLAISAQDLSTVREEGHPYSLDLTAEAGGKLHWEGVLSVPGAYSEGSLVLENISLHPLWRYAQDWLAFELKAGAVSVVGDYRVDWGGDLAYTVSNGSLLLDRIDIQPRDSNALPDTVLKIKTVELQGIELDGPEQRVEIAAATVAGALVTGFTAGGEHSLLALFETNIPDSGSSPGATNTQVAHSDWQIYLPGVHLLEGQVRWRSDYTSPPVLDVSSIDLQLTELHWPPTRSTGLSLSLVINNATTLAIDGDLDFHRGDGSFGYQLQGLPLAMANPNIPAALNAQISSGEVSIQGEVTLAKFQPTRLTMEGSSTDFTGTIDGADDALLGWQSIRWQGLDVDFLQRNVMVETVALHGYAGRIHIYEDGSINAQRVLQQEVDDALEEGTLDEEVLKAWDFAIPTISFTDSQLYFRDESLPIGFATVIGELNGAVTGLSSSARSETTIDLKGSVDGYAPVVLAGTVSLFGPTPAVDLNLSFDGVDLVRLTPYSGTYAGYAIDRGVLNLDLHYTLDGSRLAGDNAIVIQQLKLGEQVDSDQAVNLPLPLALALLTDMNGVIDMDIPISGDVNDPDFGLGGVIFSALVNVVTKAVTAPFSLLAGLVGSEDDMQRIAFSSGSSELEPAAMATLAQLTEALAQRPGINLVLLGRLHPSADRERLQKTLLGEQLRSAGLSAEEVASKGELWGQVIQQRFTQLTTQATAHADGAPTPLHQQYQQVLASVTVADQQLQALAEERSVAVKRYLLNELQFPAERAAIELVDLDDEKNVFSGVELGVDI